MDSVLVVIPCFNQGRYLAEAIESALAQTHPVDVTVVDDGSTDETAAVAYRYPVRLIRQRNRGVSAARNKGIAASDHAWILPLDADDRIEPETVEALIGLDDIVAPSCRTFGATEHLWIPRLARPSFEDFLTDNFATVTALYRREVWAAIGGYNQRMRRGGEDWEFWLKATHAGFSMTVVSDVLLRYRVYDKAREQGLSDLWRSHKTQTRKRIADRYRRDACVTSSSPPTTPGSRICSGACAGR